MKRIVFWVVVGVALAVSAKSVIAEKIAAKCRVTASDRWFGGERTIFELNGCETWVVEPEKPAVGNPWVWIMEWPGAFAKRTGVPALLAAGYRVVTFRPGFYKDGKFVSKPGNMNDRRLVESRAFQTFIVDELGLAPKANLIGMSWGGFYSIRYASTYPDCVAHIYLDAPLLDFSTLQGYSTGGWGIPDTYKVDYKTYVGKDDPRQPVNRAEPIAQAGIPILLLYGGADIVVPPGPNCERFAEAFKKFGGKITVQKRSGYGHHPHGLEVDEQQQFVNFFNGK